MSLSRRWVIILISAIIAISGVTAINFAKAPKAHAASLVWSFLYGPGDGGVGYTEYSTQNPKWQLGGFGESTSFPNAYTYYGDKLILQGDENLVDYGSNGKGCYNCALWASNTQYVDSSGVDLKFQGQDGNIVIYGYHGHVYWATNKYYPYINAQLWEFSYYDDGCMYQDGASPGAWHTYWRNSINCLNTR